MEPELSALAAAGAVALVQQMATDGWAAVRGRVARFLARGGEEDTVAGELDRARDELVAARGAEDEGAAADVLAEWRGRMRRTLRADPAAAAELREILAELEPGAEERGGSVHNSISGGVQHGAVVQSGSIGALHIGQPPAR